MNPPPPNLTGTLINKKPLWQAHPGPAGSHYYINSVAVSADGSRVVGGTFFRTYSQKDARGRPAPTSNVATTPPANATYGAYCYNGSGQLLWKDEFIGYEGVYWVGLSADGSRAAAGGLMSETAPKGFIRIYDAANQGRLMLAQSTQQRVNQVALSGNGGWVVSAAETLLLFQAGATAYTQTDSFTPDSKDGIVSTGISKDGLTIVYADYDGHVGLLRNVGGKFQSVATWKVPGTGKGDFSHMLDLAPDGSCFAAGGAGGLFYFFNVANFISTGQPTASYSAAKSGAVFGVAVAENGSLFAGIADTGDDGRSFLVQLNGGLVVGAMQTSLKRNPNSVAINAANGLYAFADGYPDGTKGHYYLYTTGNPQQGIAPHIRWIFETGNMSWPIVIAASGNAVVGGSDDSHIYYFTP